MNKVYVVCGSTGEWEDYAEWSVGAYTIKDLAIVHCELANKWCEDNGVDVGIEEYWEFEEENPYDPDFCLDNNGTRYSVSEIPIGYLEKGTEINLL